MEENKRLRRLVRTSENAPSESADAPSLPAASSLGEVSWQVPTSRELEGVHVDGIIIKSLFEQYA